VFLAPSKNVRYNASFYETALGNGGIQAPF
jgi:hypothetical protein